MVLCLSKIIVQLSKIIVHLRTDLQGKII